MDNITVGIAFSAGVLSFLSPCILPLVPGYISFISGISLEELREGQDKEVARDAGLASLMFVAGFSVVFIALGATASMVGQILAEHQTLLTRIGGALIIVLGVHLTGIIDLPFLNTGTGLSMKKKASGPLSSFMVGMVFALGWTPCIGPILAGILGLAAAQDTLLRGMALLGTYSLGLGIPFVITGFAVGFFMRFFKKYKRFIQYGKIIAGILLILIGVLMMLDSMKYLLQYLPAGGSV